MANTALAKAVRSRIRREGLTVREFRERVGLSNGGLYKILGGHVPKLQTLRALRAAGVRIPRELLAA